MFQDQQFFFFFLFLTYIQPTEKGLKVFHTLVNHPKWQKKLLYLKTEALILKKTCALLNYGPELTAEVHLLSGKRIQLL